MRDDRTMTSVAEEVCKALFGDAVDYRELIEKANPDQASLHVPKAFRKQKPRTNTMPVKLGQDRKQRAVTAGLSAVGATAGVAGLAYGANDMLRAARLGRKIPLRAKALVPLEVAGLGGEVMATKILHHDVTKKPKMVPIKKNTFDPIITARRLGVIDTETALELIEKVTLPKPLVHIGNTLKKITAGVKQEKAQKTYASNIIQSGINSVGTPTLRKLGYTSAAGAGAVGGVLGHKLLTDKKPAAQPAMPTQRKVSIQPPPVNVDLSAVKVKKSADITWTGEISKVNEEKHQVFGWATVTEIDGVPVVDRQNDLVSLEEIEKAAYEYMISSRKGGDQHRRDGAQPLQTSDLIESFLVTDEKLAQLGVDPASVSKRGWWLGFHVRDEEQWEKVKNGSRNGFSIHGSGRRQEI